MGRLQDLLAVTEKIDRLLDTTYKSNEERMKIIEELNELLEKRGTILKTIVAPYTEEETTLGKQVIELDQSIQAKMEILYDSIRADLKHLKQKKDSNKTYMNPYGKMETIDGMYLDNKL